MAFVNSFASYLVLMIVFVVVGAVAIALGIGLRKRSNAKVVCDPAVEEVQADN